jgi:3',5'-cyclic AMP phosphodiesterase CpdA
LLGCAGAIVLCGAGAVVPGCTVTVFPGGAGDNLGILLPPRDLVAPNSANHTLLARIAHVTDTHMLDEESPARFAGAGGIIHAAWRPNESYSTQLLDGIIRTVNRIHADGRPIDFLALTGDACDNVQSNELRWLTDVLDGEFINPQTGPDDRPADTRPLAWLDPHAGFQAQGLYRQGHHGELPSIPWYAVFGNHEVYALGVFPIVTRSDGTRVAPLPLPGRPGLVLPVLLNPLASYAYGNVTPAEPGPPLLFETPRPVAANAERAYFNRREFVHAMFATATGPPGHGFSDPDQGPSWYSVSPLAGLRLIGLDTTDRPVAYPEFIYSEGALSRRQFDFLKTELAAATERDEIVIVISHHSSRTIDPISGSEVSPEELRALLNDHPGVVLHLAGHLHRNRVTDRGGYAEIETCSTIDLPQEGRLIEIWRDADDDSLVISYEMFSHLDDSLPPLQDDPLRELRAQAYELAAEDKAAPLRQRLRDPSGANPAGEPADRNGTITFPR